MAASFAFQFESHEETFPYVLIMMSLISLQCFFTPAFFVGPVRKRVFSANFMSQFMDEHREAHAHLTEPVLEPVNGYPDMGNGRFSEKLTYKEWYEFNNAQRVHMNFVEQLPMVLIIILVASFTKPLAALILSIAYFLLRLIYAIGYAIKGPNFRALGAIPNLLVKLTLFGLAFYTSIQYMKFYQAAPVAN